MSIPPIINILNFESQQRKTMTIYQTCGRRLSQTRQLKKTIFLKYKNTCFFYMHAYNNAWRLGFGYLCFWSQPVSNSKLARARGERPCYDKRFSCYDLLFLRLVQAPRLHVMTYRRCNDSTRATVLLSFPLTIADRGVD